MEENLDLFTPKPIFWHPRSTPEVICDVSKCILSESHSPKFLQKPAPKHFCVR